MSSWILALSASYLVGAIPTGFLVVKWFTQQDVRTIGSGNIGATNVTRAAGPWLGLVVFFLDAGKGVIATLLIGPRMLEDTVTVRLACGLAAVIGHNFPITLGCKGGKGVATTIGVLLSSVPLVGLLYLTIWGICFAPWRYVSVASLMAAISIPILLWTFKHPTSAIWLGGLLAMLIFIRHQSNIRRLLDGTEPRTARRPTKTG